MSTRPRTRDQQQRTPWHLWVVGIFALIFSLFGAYDYTMSQLADRHYIAATAPDGVHVNAIVAYLALLPLWLVVVWAAGVWSAVGAAILLVLRSRQAYPLFVVSVTCLVVSNTWTLAHPMPGMGDGATRFATSAAIFAIMLALTIYARAMRRRGALR